MGAMAVLYEPLIYKRNFMALGVIGEVLAVMRETVGCFFKFAKLSRMGHEIQRLSTGTSIAETHYR
jgi:hypothetical protein